MVLALRLPLLLVLVSKHYIYYCKCANEIPNFHDLLNEIESICSVESFNAICKIQFSKHCKNDAQSNHLWLKIQKSVFFLIANG